MRGRKRKTDTTIRNLVGRGWTGFAEWQRGSFAGVQRSKRFIYETADGIPSLSAEIDGSHLIYFTNNNVLILLRIAGGGTLYHAVAIQPHLEL